MRLVLTAIQVALAEGMHLFLLEWSTLRGLPMGPYCSELPPLENEGLRTAGFRLTCLGICAVFCESSRNESILLQQ